MALNDFQLGLVGHLDGTKSKNQLNQDIKAIYKTLEKLKLRGEFDQAQIQSLERQLNSLKVELNNATFSQSAIDGLVNQINNGLNGIQIQNINIGGNAQQIGQQIGQQINNGISQSLQNSTNLIDNFKLSLQNLGMAENEINAVVAEIQRANVQIDTLNQSMSNTRGKRGTKNILNVEVSGLDKFGNAVKFTKQFNSSTGALIKNLKTVSTAAQEADSSLDKLAAQQISKRQSLANQIFQSYRSAIDQNSDKTISNPTRLSELESMYNQIRDAIDNMGSVSRSEFAQQEADISAMIANFKNLVREYRNAENISTALKPDKLASGISKAESRFVALNAEIKASGVSSQKLEENLKIISDILNKRNRGEVLNKSEVEQAHTSLTNAKNELDALVKTDTANSSLKRLKLQADSVKTSLQDFAVKNNGFDTFTKEIDGATVSLNTLITDLGSIKTPAELDVVKEKIKSLKTAFQSISVVDIKTSLGDNGSIASEIQILKNNFTKLGLSSENVTSKMATVNKELTELKELMSNSSSSDDQIISKFNKLKFALSETQKNLKLTRSEYSLLATDQQRLSLANTIEAWNQKNTAATQEVRNENEKYILSLRDLSEQMEKTKFKNIQTSFKAAENSMRAINKLGASVKDQFKQAYQSFTMWLSASAAVMKVISETKEAVTELKEIDTLLTEISKANDKLSETQLADVANNSFEVASKYGKKSTDYLSGVQEASRAGYTNADEIAELSTAAQGAGDMTAELANQMIIATDKAYKLGGSAEKLTEVLDGVNYITNHNAVNMSELSEGLSIVGSTAASFGIEANQLTAALGTMAATTQQSGSEVARAFRAILLNIRQVSDEEEGIDAEGLTKYENACNALGVSLKETKNGIQELRDPMEVLHDLSIEYNKLSETDVKRTNLLNSVGGKLRSTQLDALLRQWSMYETMLQQYEDGTGSMAREAEKTAQSWEGSLNRLSNTWTDTVENVANSDAIITGINALNNLLSVVNELTDNLGSLGTIGLGAGLFAGFKNVGRLKMQSLIVLNCRQ